MTSLKLHMVLLGSTLPGRNTEQHDIFFGIGETIYSLFPTMMRFWPEAKNKLHIDAWREVTVVGDHEITVIEKNAGDKMDHEERLFFINLGGYRNEEFEEFHYKILTVATSKAEAISISKKSAFFKHAGFKGAESHIDDKFGVDVDDIFQIPEILSVEEKLKYTLQLTQGYNVTPDTLHLGYLKMNHIK